jgi:rapamycin-insensitive companion of mTOR
MISYFIISCSSFKAFLFVDILTHFITLHCYLSYSMRILLCQHSNTLTILSFKFLTVLAHQTKLVLLEVGRKHVDHFIARALELESSAADPSPVRAAAFALVIAMINSYKPEETTHVVAHEILPMPPSIVEALRETVVDHMLQDDPYSRIALDALAQIAVRNPALAASSQVFTVMIEAIVNPYFKAMQEALIIAILFLMNDASSRQYLYNVEHILAPLNGAQGSSGLESLQLSVRALTIMLKSWPGLIWAAKTGGMMALVSGLRHKDPNVQSIILDAFFEVLRIPHPDTSNPFQRQEVVFLESDPGDSLIMPQSTSDDGHWLKKQHRHNLVANYVAVMLMCFTDIGLVEALIDLVNHTEERTKVTVLLAELLYLSNTLVPKETCARLQQAPTLLKKAVSFEIDAHLRSRASTMITNLHKYTNLKASEAEGLPTSLLQTKQIEDRRLGRVDEVKKKIDWEMDEATLASKLRQTQVLSYGLDEWSKWKFEFIIELFDGPLRNPALLSVALKTKLFKHVLNFFSPTKRLFSELPWSYENLLYVRAGCQAIEVLCESEVGKTYLNEHILLKQMADLLSEEVVKLANKNAKDQFWSLDRMLKTMAREYFTLLGVFSRTERGLSILRRYDMFKTIRSLCEESGRDDIVNLILTSLDYEHRSECHNILEVVLGSKSAVMRYLATRHMRQLLRYGVSNFHTWGIDLVTARVVDTDAKVRSLALEILDEAVDDEQAMGRLISARPALGNTPGLGRALQIRFLSSKAGLKFLKEIDFIVPELEKWLQSENIAYVDQVERRLASVLNRSLNRRVNSQDTAFTHSFSAEDEVFVPPHFFGELSKTKEGCKLLKKSNAINKFIKTIKSPKYSHVERRSAIWALGHVASSESGWTFLQPLNVALLLADIVTSTTADLCTKGTCFYVLGMMSALPQVRVTLGEIGWEFPEQRASRVALPINLHHSPLFSLPDYPSSFLRADSVELPDVYYQNGRGYYSAPVDLSDPRAEVIMLCQNLSNSVVREQTWRGLRRLRSKHPELFADPILLFEVWKLFEMFSFRLTPRRQLVDFFAETVFTEEAFDHIDAIWPVH